VRQSTGYGLHGRRRRQRVGAGDPALAELRARIEPVLYSSLVERLREGQAQGEIDPAMNAEDAARFIQETGMKRLMNAVEAMLGLDLRAGVAPSSRRTKPDRYHRIGNTIGYWRLRGPYNI
jgi:hypothetical protein